MDIEDFEKVISKIFVKNIFDMKSYICWETNKFYMLSKIS